MLKVVVWVYRLLWRLLSRPFKARRDGQYVEQRPLPPWPSLALRVPDIVAPRELPRLLALRLQGTPAAGTPAGAAADALPRAVIWVDQGDELLVHLDSIRTVFSDRAVLVSIDVETDQTERGTLVVPFAIGDSPGGLPVLVFESFPRGPEALARRWGPVVQEALYAAVIDMVVAHAAQNNALPATPYISDKTLRFGAKVGR